MPETTIRVVSVDGFRASSVPTFSAGASLRFIHVDGELAQVECPHGLLPIQVTGTGRFFWCVDCNLRVTEAPHA
jgi:hypothetical protein